MKYFILYFVHVLMRIKNFKQTNIKLVQAKLNVNFNLF